MTECSSIELRERLPDYLAGALSREEVAAVESHLVDCSACAAELALLESARSVFASAAPQVDVDAIVAALPRLSMRPGNVVSLDSRRREAARTLPPSVRQTARMRRPAIGLALAAAISLAAVGIWNSQDMLNGDRGGPGSQVVTSGLSFGGDVSDLSDEALLALLNDLDNLEAAPPAEPDPDFAYFNDLAGD